MARSDYGPEIRGAMSGHAGEVEKPSTPSGRTRINTKPRMPGLSAQAQGTDAITSGTAHGTIPAQPKSAQNATQKSVNGSNTPIQPHLSSKPQTAGNADPPGQGSGLPPDAFHVQHAAGIAHAILGNRRMV